MKPICWSSHNDNMKPICWSHCNYNMELICWSSCNYKMKPIWRSSHNYNMKPICWSSCNYNMQLICWSSHNYKMKPVCWSSCNYKTKPCQSSGQAVITKWNHLQGMQKASISYYNAINVYTGKSMVCGTGMFSTHRKVFLFCLCCTFSIYVQVKDIHCYLECKL